MSEERKAKLLQRLAKSRLRLRTLLMRLDEEQWQTEVYADTENWQVIHLVRHLMDAERGIALNANNIANDSQGVPPDFDINRYNKSRVKKLASQGPKELLQELAKNRAALLEQINALPYEKWDTTGRAADLRTATVEDLFDEIARHELQHATDIASALGIEPGTPSP